MNYLRNIRLWLSGFTRFSEVTFKLDWSNDWRWKALYLVDYGACVLVLAGAVEPVSTYSQRHRKGRVWDGLLDLIERFDPGHGVHSGGPLWGSVESSQRVRIVVPAVWALVILWTVFA